ncbi:MAG: PaaI family thioesterase [Desulfomonilaceae bacterium]
MDDSQYPGRMLDHIRMYLSGQIPPPPIAQLIGFQMVSVEEGEAVVQFEATERHSNPMGTLHGGVLCDIADAAMGMAYASALEPGETLTTLELKINFLKPIWTGKLRAIGRVVKRGGTVGLVECDVLDENNQLAARASSTCMTLKGRQAKGREIADGGQ